MGSMKRRDIKLHRAQIHCSLYKDNDPSLTLCHTLIPFLYYAHFTHHQINYFQQNKKPGVKLEYIKRKSPVQFNWADRQRKMGSDVSFAVKKYKGKTLDFYAGAIEDHFTVHSKLLLLLPAVVCFCCSCFFKIRFCMPWLKTLVSSTCNSTLDLHNNALLF